MRDEREEPTDYVAPYTGDKMRALYALGLADLSNGAKAIGSALIWHANSITGRCDPGLQRLAFETGRCRQTVINAIGELKRKHVLSRQRRGQSTNAYHLNWPFLARKFEEFETSVTSVTFLRQGYKNLDLGSPEPCTSGVQNLVPEPIKRTHELNSLPEWAHPPSAADAYDDFFENHFDGVTQLHSGRGESSKGFQEEPTGFSSRHWWLNRLAEAEAAQETSDPEQRKQFKAKIARYRARIEEMPYDKRPKVGAGGR